MDVREYLRILRAHWLSILVIVALTTGAAVWYGTTRDPVYAAETKFFVSSAAEPADPLPSDAYQGGLFTQARVQSYAALVSSLEVAEAVAADVDPSMDPRVIQNSITATVPEETVLIQVRVEDTAPARAKEIADSVTSVFPEFVDEVESTTTGESPVKVTVTDPPQLPTKPEFNPMIVYPTIGLVLGLLLGAGAAVLRETFDKRIRYGDTAETIGAAPVIGRIAHDSKAKSRPVAVLDGAETPAAEGYRQLRTNLRALMGESDIRSLVVTSAVPREGKTLVTANLAFAFAEAGHRVVLVDGDMRRSGLTRLLELEQAPGLSDVLTGNATGESPHAEYLHVELDLPLEVLTSGSPQPNPNELLESERFTDLLARLTERADLVLLDSPAILPVSDAAVMAQRASGVILVARSSSTRAGEFHEAARSLRAVGRQPIGIILDGHRRRSRTYSYARPEDIERTRPRAPAWDSRSARA